MPKPLTREELYELVWANPMQHVAPQLGISDVGLAKICRKANIPLPGRGYWAKKRVGQAVEQQPLPALSTAQLAPPSVRQRARGRRRY